MKSTLKMFNISKETEFLCDQFKRKSWKVICKKYMSRCEWMIHFHKIDRDMQKTGKMIDHNYISYTYKEDRYNLNNRMIVNLLIPYII